MDQQEGANEELQMEIQKLEESARYYEPNMQHLKDKIQHLRDVTAGTRKHLANMDICKKCGLVESPIVSNDD